MTAQCSEKLIFKGRTVEMTCEPLKEYLAEKSINFPLINTACWRGYIGSWEIKDNKLYLISLDDFSDEGISLHHIFSDYTEAPYHFKQFSGEITFVEGENLEYIHGGFGGVYEYETHLSFKDGCLISGYKTKYVPNPHYVDAKWGTPEYEKLKANQKNKFIPQHFKIVVKRLISPPRCEWDSLRQPLELGERRFLEYLDENLGEGWEIYIQPAFNGLCPDIIIMHPNKGICIFEVKNWDFKVIHYESYVANNGKVHLKGNSKSQGTFKVEKNPVDQLLLYRKEMRHLYCPQLDTSTGGSVLFCGLVFPSASDDELETIVVPIFESRNRVLFSKEHSSAKYVIFSKDNFEKSFEENFPKGITSPFNNSNMNPKIAEYLRYWLIEPDAAKEQRTSLTLDKKQLEFATTRPNSGYRRLKGPAGSGKSLVVAKKATHLLQQKKSVLICTFNITLTNYLADLAVREYPRARKDATWLNFHYLASRICISGGLEEEYNALFQNKDEDFIDNDELCNLVEKALDRQDCQKYDAILVDEGQDYNPRWWNILRKLLHTDGEMLLVADTTQDIYGQGKLWTDQAMSNAGFVGAWASLENTYRLPSTFIPMVQDFAETYIPQANIILPQPAENTSQEDLFADDVTNAENFIFRWIQVPKFLNDFSNFSALLNDPIDSFQEDMRTLGLSFADQTYLVTKHEHGMALCKILKYKKISVTDVFSADWKESRRKKQYFFKGSQSAKACTIHSYKGWESRSLFLIIDRFDMNSKDAEIIYTALTRLKGGGKCVIYIVCADSKIAEFGKKWDGYYNKIGLI